VSDPLLSVKGLRTWFPIKRGVFRKTVGHVRAVDDVSFDVPRGKTVALVGESGCGKTTVGRSLLRLVEPQAGEVFFHGKNLLALEPEALRQTRRKLQMVFQDPTTSLDPKMRVRDILSEGLKAFGVARTQADLDARAETSLEKVSLDARHLERYPHEFSGGQRQRIGIARALSVEPELIILDEAVSALDVSIQAQILNLLRRLQSEMGLSFLFITHDLSVVRYLADWVCVMYLGQIVEQGPAERLFERPHHPYTRALLASVPSADPAKRALGATLLGDVPSPANPPPGCRFHTRCPYVMDKCKVQPPEARMLDGVEVRCHLDVLP
jgi:peptide/nickel transport system ATP-binding protein